MLHHMTLCLAISALAAGAAATREPRSPNGRRYRSQPPVATIPGALDPLAN